MTKLISRTALVYLFFLSACASAQELDVEKIAPERVIVVGDVHGDFKQFRVLLEQAGVINKRKKWRAGKAILVQLGDVTDRGPDSLKVIRLLQDLSSQAQAVGGRVEVLLGNHEMMNMIGDLRYVHAGEFAALRDGNSRSRRNSYYEKVKAAELAAVPEGEAAPEFNKAHRKQFDVQHPLGFVEHRLLWQAAGELGQWALARPTVLKIADTLYVHAGLSPDYLSESISSINTRVRTALVNSTPKEGETLIIDDANGPLWYRGWTRMATSPENHQRLDAVLNAFDVKRMVVAHTPLVPTVLPRFDGKILMVDVGMAKHYGHGTGLLELINSKPFVRHGKELIAIPEVDADVIEYLDKVALETGSPTKLVNYRDRLKNKLEMSQKAKSLPAAVNE